MYLQAGSVPEILKVGDLQKKSRRLIQENPDWLDVQHALIKKIGMSTVFIDCISNIN